MRVEAAATAIHKVVLAVVVAAPHLEAPAAARALQLDDVGGPLFGRAVPGEARRGGGEVDIPHLGVADGDEAGAVTDATIPPQLRPIPHAGGDDDAILGRDIMTQEIFGRRPGPLITRPIPAVGDDQNIRRELEQVAEVPRVVLVVEPRYADPLSLVFYKKVLVTKAAVEQLKEMLA